MISLFSAVALTPREHSIPLLVRASSVDAALKACIAYGFVTANIHPIPIGPRQINGVFLTEDATTGFFTSASSVRPVSSDGYWNLIEDCLESLRTELIGSIQLQLIPLKDDQLILFTRQPQGFLTAMEQGGPEPKWV